MLYSVSDKNKRCMCVWDIKYELYNFGDSANELNSFIFEFNIGIA